MRALNHSKQDEELLSDCIAAQLNLDIDALADALDAIPIEERLRLPPGFIEPQPRSEMVKALREPKQEDAVLSPQENVISLLNNQLSLIIVYFVPCRRKILPNHNQEIGERLSCRFRKQL